MLDEAVTRARAGERVLILVHDQEMVDYFRAHIDSTMGAEHLQITIKSATEGGGRFLGFTWNALLIDHYVHESANIPNLAVLIGFIRTRIMPAQR